MTLLDLVASLKMDVSQFMSGSRAAKQEMAGLKTEATGLNNELGLTAEEIESVNSAMMQSASSTAAAGLAFSAITAAIVGVASEAIALASSFHQAEIGFATMMGSAQDAKQFLNELKTFAASSPFGFPELLDASRRLQAMGFEATAVIPIMRTVGDAVAGLGGNAAMIDRITLALGQMQAKGKVSAQEMNQLAEAGIPAWQSLADQIGVGIPEAMKRAEQGAISAAEAIPAILQGMQDRFGGLMTANMNTVTGQWSNFKDQLSFILADIGTAILPFAQMVLSAANPIIEVLRDMAAGFAALPQPVQGIIVGLTGMIAAIGPALLAFAGLKAGIAAVAGALGLPGTVGLVGVIGSLSTILLPLVGVIVAAGAAWYAWDNIPAVSEAVTGLWTVLTDFWNDTLKPVLETVTAAGVAFVKFAADIAGSALGAIWGAIKDAGMGVWDVMTALVGIIAPLWDAFGNLLDAVSPLIEPILAMWQGFLKLEAILAAGILIGAWKVLSTVAEGFWFIVKELASFLTNNLIGVFNVFAAATRGTAEGFNTYLRPAIEFVTAKFREFLGVLAQIPGIKQAIEALNGTWDGMKNRVGSAVDDARGKIRALGSETESSLKQARDAVDAAKRSYDEMKTKFQQGKVSADELNAATQRLAGAQANFKGALDAARPSINVVIESVVLYRKEQDEAEKAVKKLEIAQRNGANNSSELVAAHARLKTASENVKVATGEMEKITRDTGVTMNQYSGTLDEVRASLNRKTVAAGPAIEVTKELKKSVDAAALSYRAIYDQWQNGKKTEDDVINAHTRLQEAIDKLHPEKVAERQAKGHDEMMKRYDDLLKWFETNFPKLEALNESLILSNAKLASEFSKAHEKMKVEALKQIEIRQTVSDQLSNLNDYDASEAIKAAIRMQKEVQEAYKQLGITSSATLSEKVVKAKDAYEKITASVKSSVGDQLNAEKAYLEAVIEEYKNQGQQIPEAIKERLREIEAALGISTNRQVDIWKDAVKKIKDIFRDLKSDLGAVIGGSIWDSIIGNNDNSRLDEQAAELTRSLNERAQEWERYQQEVAGAIEAIRQEHADELAEEIADLRAALEEKREEYENYVAATLEKLEEFKQAQADKLAEEQANLARSLEARGAEWEAYKAKAAEGLAEFTARQDAALEREITSLLGNLAQRQDEWLNYRDRTLAELGTFTQEQDAQLAEELSNLAANLTDRAAEWAEYQAEAAAGLVEFRAEQDANLSEELGDLRRSLEEKRSDYFEYVNEVNEKLQELNETSAEKLAADLERLRESFEDKTEAYEEYVTGVNQKLARIGEDFEESVDDERRDTQRSIDDKRRMFDREEREINDRIARELAKGAGANQQQIADWRRTLAEKREDMELYVRRQEEDLAEFVDDHQRAVNRQTTDLQNELAERQKAQYEAQLAYESNVESVTTTSQRELQRQTTDLQSSLAERTTDWTNYQTEIANRMSQAQIDHDNAITAEERKVSLSLNERGAAWLAYQADIKAKQEQAQRDHDNAIATEAQTVASSLTARQLAWENYRAEIERKIQSAHDAHDAAIAGEAGKVAQSLAEREAAWQAYQEEVARKLAAAQQKHDEAVAAEQLKVQTSLGARELEWTRYQAMIAAKIEAATRKHDEEAAKEVADLIRRLDEKRAEYDKYVADILAKLEQIERDHTTVWGRIKDSLIDLMSDVGRSITQTLFAALTDTLFDRLKQSKVWQDITDFLTGIFDNIGSIISDIFSTVADAIGGIFSGIFTNNTSSSGPTIGGGQGPIVLPPSGGSGEGSGGGLSGGAVGGGAAAGAGIGFLIAGPLGAAIGAAIGGLASTIIGTLQSFSIQRTEADIEKIEESTRLTKVQVIDVFTPLFNTHFPKIGGIEDKIRDGLIPSVDAAKDEVIAKGVDITRAVNESKNVLIEVKEFIHSIITTHIPGIVTALGNISFDSVTNLLTEIRDALTGAASDIATFSAQDIETALTNTETAIKNAIVGVGTDIANLSTSFGSSLSTHLTTAASTILGGFGTLRSEFDDIDFSDITGALGNISMNITQAIGNNNPSSAITTALNTINATIGFHGANQYNQLLTIGNRINVQPATPQVNVQVFNTSQSISSQVFGQGVRI